jgi:hypothetical protein
MAKLIVIKINALLIDKAHLFKGAKGTYLDLVLRLNDEPNQYGDHGMVTQGVSKEMRAAGVRGAILGNAKIMADLTEKPAAAKAVIEEDLSDDLPF